GQEAALLLAPGWPLSLRRGAEGPAPAPGRVAVARLEGAPSLSGVRVHAGGALDLRRDREAPAGPHRDPPRRPPEPPALLAPARRYAGGGRAAGGRGHRLSRSEPPPRSGAAASRERRAGWRS